MLLVHLLALTSLLFLGLFSENPPKQKQKNLEVDFWIEWRGGGDENLVSDSLCISNTDDTDRYFSYT